MSEQGDKKVEAEVQKDDSQDEEATIQFVILYRSYPHRALIEIEAASKGRVIEQWAEATRKHVKDGRNVSVKLGDTFYMVGDIMHFGPFEDVYFPEIDPDIDDEDEDEDEFFAKPSPGGMQARLRRLPDPEPEPAKEPAKAPAFMGPDPSSI